MVRGSYYWRGNYYREALLEGGGYYKRLLLKGCYYNREVTIRGRLLLEGRPRGGTY